MRWWEHYRLLEEAGDGGDGGGGGGDPPPADPPADPPSGDPPAATTIPLTAIPEELRDRPEAEIKFLLEHMASQMGSKNNRVEDLEKEVAELRGAITAPPVEPDPDDDKPMAELILENPEKALDRWAKDRGYVVEMGSLSDRVGEAEFSMVAAELTDFDEHESRIRAILKSGKLAVTKANIHGAYKLALGEAVIEARARDARADTTLPPSNAPPPEGGDEVKLDDLETEIMHGHGITDPKEWIKYRDNPPALKLPT